MNESLLNRLLRDRKRQRRMLVLILCLSMIVSLGTFAGFHKNAIAKVYTREVLDCPYAHEGAEPVSHRHNDDCYEGDLLVCTLPEREAHTHADACYAELQVLRCGLEESEEHQHTGECFDEDGALTCGMEAGEGAHVHSEACFENEYALICDQPELPTHVHGPECFRTEEITVDEPEEVIEPETPAQPEQTIPEMPVSDPNADLETAEDWNREFENFELSGNWARDLVLVAATQQGRGESPNNFEAVLNDAGDAWVKHGYTRYGAWYGVPYADEWSAMFVSFCLRYAGIPAENVPNNPTAAFMAESFSMGELFAGRDYVPAAGDLIFFGTVDDDIVTIDHMGIVYHVDPENGTINTVEGDRTNAVATFGYYLDDEQIVGYGILPQNPNYIPAEGEFEEKIDEAFDGFIFMTTDEEEEPKETETVEETTDTDEATVPAVPMPAQSWERTAGGIKVSVEAPEGAFPESTHIAVTPVNGSSLMDTVSDAVNGAILEVQAVDITFFDAEGHEIEPAVPIRVVMTPAATEHAEEKTSVVHVDIAQQTAELIEQAEGTETDNSEVVFDTDAFTIYAIVYTVDFEYTVNGNVYRFNLPGGSFITLRQLIETLGVTEGEEQTGIEKFVSDIENAVFSDPSLVWVGKAESDTTVGQLKTAFDLNSQYSTELTDEQITEFNNSPVSAGEWVLLSLKPFTSIESLTVTMKDGEVWTVKVTDAQISANVITADGITFTIIVTYDEAAQIPDGTILQADEIEFGTDEYLQYLGRTWSEVNRAFSESADRSEDARYVNVNAARFFDIKLLYQGEEIEPLAPVQVEITYTDGLPSWANTKPGVVHFKPDEIEVLEEVQTEVAGEAAVSFHYELDSFSVIGTYIQQETHDVETPPYGAYSYSPNAPVFAASADYAVPEASEGNGVLTIPPVALRANGEGEAPSTADDSGLPLPNGNKSLDPNGDGTYTLTLSVKGSSQTTIQKVQKKANVLFVMDRSSSMITNTVSDDESFWYYGTLATAQLRGDISPANGYQFYGVINGNYVELNASSTWTSWYNYSLTYNRWNGNTWVTENYPDTSPIYVKSHTTRLYAEQAALEDVIGRLLAYNTAETPDEIEVAVISFADHRSDSKGWTETEHGWVQGTDRTSLMDAINSTKFASGTNWEEALRYAYSVINAKKTAEADKPEEDYYVVFLTDGEPTNMVGDTSAAQHTGDDGNLVAYNAAKDDALELVSNGFKFYNIFTYRIDESEKYSKYLTNYAYGQGDYNENETEALNTYFSDAQTVDALNNTFNNIFLTIANVIGHANVSITDTMTTDAMTTTVVQGKTNGYVYTVKDPSGTVLYTVRATGDIDNPTVTFIVPSSATKNYTATETDVDEKKLYSITTAEGQKYGIALADVNNTTGELTWDLSPVGILMDDCTYSVSFVVWPDQNAYDYVAGLNNGLSGFTWNEEAAVDSGKGYKSGGVSQYPSIVKYPDGTYAVLTNTDQKIHYSVVEMETINGEPNGDPEVHGPYYSDLQTPNPMPLEASESSLEKKWNVERDPGILAQLLYNLDGSSSEFSIEYDIMRGDEEEPYVSINLGWDAGKGEYVWEPGSVRNVTYNGHTVQVGTRWAEDFAIATGLMLSEEHMDARGLDKSAYPSGIWNGVTYYVLETGHDYTIIEKIDEESASKVGYEFDFVSPVYHPMLVDGVLRSVNYTKTGDSITITSMTDATVDLQSLQVQNTLRGYINLEKVVLGKDGRTPVPEDDTKFEYRVELRNATDPGPFTVEGDHVPWYGISGLFYHDADFNYYQAYPAAEGIITLTDAHGNTFSATSDDFKESVGPATLHYTDNGVEKTLVLYGNQMEHNSDNYVSATIKISQGEVLNIANVPAGTTYTITETLVNGYDLVSILREIRNGTVAESSELSTGSPVAAGTIVADRDNHIIYTNKIHSVDLTVKKVDGNNEVLTGAVFTLTKEAGGDETGTVYTRPDGDETDTGTYMFSDLQDGSYTLSETPPPGYTGIADLTFTVTDGAIAEMSNLPDGATWDGSNLTLTVVNTPTPGVLTVRKQWQDFFGNPISYTGTLDLKLVQYVENTSANYNVTVNFRYEGDNGKPFATKTGTGVGPATIQWQWNSNTTYPGVHNITVTGLNNGEYSVTSGNNYWFTLSIPNVNRDMTITVNVNNYNYNPYHYDGSNITDVNITEAVVTEGYQATGGVRTISLGGNGNWTEAFTMSGDGILQDNNDSTIPITYNGKTCYYLIEEESVPDGFTLHQISGDVVQSGVLTAYNRKTSVDVQVEKVDKTNASTKLNGATFTLRQIDPTKTGNIGTRSLDGGKTDTRTTANGGKLSFTDLGFGYYEIKETVAPDGYIIGPAKAFYIKIDDSGVQLLQMDESVPAEQWGSISSNAMVTTIQNASVTVVNEPGVVLPQTGGIGTTLFTALGGIMTAAAGAVLALASRRRRKWPTEG